MSRDVDDLDPYLISRWWALKAAFEEDHPQYELRLTYTWRSVEDQQRLYAQGRTAPGRRVTGVDGVRRMSNHNYTPARAFDVGVFLDGTYLTDESVYDLLGEYAVPLALAWGGNWRRKDRPHFEIPKDTDMSMLLSRRWIMMKLLKSVSSNTEKYAEKFAAHVNKRVDIPGIPESVEGAILKQISLTSLTVLIQVLAGQTPSSVVSKRLIALQFLGFVSEYIDDVVAEIDIPFLSEESEENVASMIQELIDNDLIPWAERTF